MVYFSSYLPLTHFALVFPLIRAKENYSPHCGYLSLRDAMISKTNVE